jgi:hypothetical protein
VRGSGLDRAGFHHGTEHYQPVNVEHEPTLQWDFSVIKKSSLVLMFSWAATWFA